MNRAAAALLLLAACGSAPPVAAPGPLDPSADGFDIGGSDLEIGFGRAETGAVAAATKLQGRAPVERVTAGSCSRAVWADGLTMYFRSGSFVGWADPAARGGATQGGVPC